MNRISPSARCARCDQHNPQGARFCNQCGAPLAPSAAPELRRLTIMFCDLVGSVELASQLDPEDWHAVLGAYQAAAGDAIRRRHGHIAQHLGDGLVAYFGYPLASEDDAVRAAQAALELVQAVAGLAAPRSGARLQVRVGLHTGAAVMGHVGGDEGDYLAMGDTPNIAARIQALAPPNGVLLSPATRTLVGSRVRGVDRGEYLLKGFPTAMRLHQALAMRRPEDGGPGASGLSPFLGRAREMELLARRWDEAAAGPGRCLLLQGDPGMGKSRLARELRARASGPDAIAWTLRCSAHAANTPFGPLVQVLRQAMASIGAGEGGADALSAVLAGVGIRDDAVAAPLRALLAIAAPADTEAPLSAQALRERTFAAATSVLRTISARRRSLMIVEDLHWADPSTREWVGRLLRRELPPGLLILLLARPEFDADWSQGPRVERLALDPCSAADAAAMVVALDREGALSAGAVAGIVERAEGNPLFVEEFTRSALEAEGEDIPLTLQEQTMARLDRLGPARQVLQQAAVIGRHFSRQQLLAASGLDAAVVDEGLGRGVEAHLLRRAGDADGGQFTFHHALLRDAAYASLLRSVRQASHARVAQAILSGDPSSALRQPELLAYHYTEAGQAQAAVAHWLTAARQALARSACVEAATHARTALRLLGDPGENVTALSLELELQLVYAPALMTRRGVLDPEVEQTYSRARELCQRLGNGPKLLVPLWGLWAYELMRGEIERARGIARQLRALAEAGPPSTAALVAAATAGMTLFYQGDLQGARAECAKGLGENRLPPSASRSARGVHDPGVMCHAFHSLACWLLGDTQTAGEGAAALRGIVPGLPPFDAAYAWCADALLHTLAGEAAQACESAERAIAIGKEQAFPAWQMMGTMMLGWGEARQGRAAAAIPRMQRSFETWCASGARNLRPLFLLLLADASLAAGDPAQAARHAGHGLAEAASGEHCWDPELHRLQAEALAQQGEGAAAVACARRAVASAQDMGARIWAGRAGATLERIAGRQAGAA